MIATLAAPVPPGGAFYDRAVDAQLAEGRQHLGVLAVSFGGGAGGRSGHFDDREFACCHRVVPVQSRGKVPVSVSATTSATGAEESTYAINGLRRDARPAQR